MYRGASTMRNGSQKKLGVFAGVSFLIIEKQSAGVSPAFLNNKEKEGGRFHWVSGKGGRGGGGGSGETRSDLRVGRRRSVEREGGGGAARAARAVWLRIKKHGERLS